MGVILTSRMPNQRVQNLCQEYGIELDLEMQVQQLPVVNSNGGNIKSSFCRCRTVDIRRAYCSTDTPGNREALYCTLKKWRLKGFCCPDNAQIAGNSGICDRVTVFTSWPGDRYSKYGRSDAGRLSEHDDRKAGRFFRLKRPGCTWKAYFRIMRSWCFRR